LRQRKGKEGDRVWLETEEREEGRQRVCSEREKGRRRGKCANLLLQLCFII